MLTKTSEDWRTEIRKHETLNSVHVQPGFLYRPDRIAFAYQLQSFTLYAFKF